MFINQAAGNNKWFTSTQLGSVQMMGADNDGIIKVLDSCLIAGYGLKSPVSVTKDGDNLTLNYGVAHNYLSNQVLLIAGADDALLNGEHRIKSLTNNTLTISAPGVLSTTGSISTKLAPLNWESVFGSTDPTRRAYRSRRAASSKRVIFVDMSNPVSTHKSKKASISVYGDMQQIGIGVNNMTASLNGAGAAGSLFWYQKRGTDTGTAVQNTVSPWVVVGNDTHFYIMINWADAYYSSSIWRDIYGFGEMGIVADNTAQDKTFLIAAYSVDDLTVPQYGGVTPAKFTSNVSTADVLKVYAAPNTAELSKFAVSPYVSGVVTSGVGGTPFPSTYGDAVFATSLKVFASGNEIIGFLPTMLFIESSLIGQRDCSVINDLLLVSTQGSFGSAATPSTIGFYVGG